MAARIGSGSRPGYLDVQALVGITKHMGGYGATNDLLSLCHVQNAQDVLYVGSGIGVGPAYIAGRFGCRVVAVDISEKMIEWSRRRVKQAGVEARVELQIADVLQLPLETGRFDAVIVESVLAFVSDKPKAIKECVRVTKPGGYVGLNETVWLKEPTAAIAAQAHSLGTFVLSVDAWRGLWDESGLLDRSVSTRSIDPRREIRDRVEWVGWRQVFAAWGRVLRLYVTSPAGRESIKEQLDAPLAVLEYMGYALFVGRK